MTEAAATLNQFRKNAGLTHPDLWLRYFGLGGMSSAFEVEAYLYGALEPTVHDRDVLVHALNERFTEMGRDHPVPYSDDDPQEAPDSR